MASNDELGRISAGCDRYLSRHGDPSLSESLEGLVAEVREDDRSDFYGRGGVIAEFESEIAERLGKPAAVFMPSGTMAQQIAMRIHCDRSGIASIAYHPTSHLELHEQQGLVELHGIRARLCGNATSLMTAADLAALPGEVAAVLVELPQRELGGALPTWESLEELIGVARNREMMTHLDGARLWECEPYYGRSLAEIAAHFDSVYVSFYKILGGIAGAVLAGETEMIDEARLWQRRYGGNLVHLYPLVLSARAGLKQRSAKMRQYHERAVKIAAAISSVPGVSVTPNPPPANMMHVYIAADPAHVERENLAIAEQDKVLLFRSLRPCRVPQMACFEISVGDAAEAIADDELVRWFSRLAQVPR